MDVIYRNIANVLLCRKCTKVCNEANHSSCIPISTHLLQLLSFRLPIAFVPLLITLFFVVSSPSTTAQATMEPIPVFTVADSHSDCSDFIQIDGATNVNQFYFVQNLPDKMQLQSESDAESNTLQLKIPARNFKSSNPRMREDFLDLIQADKYPFIQITMHLRKDQLASLVSDTFYPDIDVQLAGKSHSYKIPGRLRRCKDQSIHVFGEVHLYLDDFGIEPPSKFFGLVKVKNEVFINFGLTLTD